MPCNTQAQIDRIPGKWVQMGDQGPPANASPANRAVATTTASDAADQAAAAHCGLGECKKGICSATPNGRSTRVYEFEERQTPAGWFIRALCSMKYDCDCVVPPPKANGDKKAPKQDKSKR